MRKKQEYDWLDDPFNDKKNEQLRMSGGNKAVVGIGCAVALVLVVIVAVGALLALGSIGSEL